MRKKILILQLDKTEQPGFISAYLEETGNSFETIKVFGRYSPPNTNLFSHLIVLPSPKDTFECDKYPFLSFTKSVINNFIIKGKYVLGICMGCQLVAECLGGKVNKMAEPEIGFYKLNILHDSPLLKGINKEKLEVFQWHSMEVSTINKILVLANSNSCKTQAFQSGNNVFGIQFHLEINEGLINLYLRKFDPEKKYTFIKTMTKELRNFKIIQKQILNNFLDLG